MPPRHKHHDLSLLHTKLQNIAQDLETLRCQQLTFFEQHSYLLPVGNRSIPEFTGSTAPNNIVDWLDDCEVFFASNSIPKDRRVSLATKSLRGRAAIWWKNLKSNHLRDCKPKFCDWNKFKKKFNREFNPDNHVPDRRLTSSCTVMDGHRRGRWSPPTVHISDANQTPPVPPYTANHRHLSSYSSRQPAPSLLPAQQYSRRKSSSPEGPERSGSTRSRRHVGFNLISSTSMSCPHVTTDYNKCKNGERIQDVATGKPSTPFDHGAGHVDPLSVLDPDLVYDASSSAVPGGASLSTFQPPPVTPPTDSPSSSAISGLASSSTPVPPSSAAHFSTSAVLASCHKVKDNGQEFLLADKEIPLLFDKSAIPLKIPLPFNPLAFVDDENVDNIMEDHVIGDVGHLLVERRACLSPAVSNSGNVYDGPPIFDDEPSLIDFLLLVYDTEPVEDTCNIFESDGEDYEPRFPGFDLTYDVPCFDGDVDFVSQTNFNYFIANDSFFVSGSLKPPSYRLRILSHIRTADIFEADIFEAHIHAMLINFAFTKDDRFVAFIRLLGIILLQIRGRIFSKRRRMMEIIF